METNDSNNNNINDVIEVLTSIAVSLGAMNKNISDMAKDLNTMGKAIADNTLQQSKELAGIKLRVESIANSSEAIQKAFYYNTDEGKPGSVYHMAGSLNSIKHAMPGFEPNHKNKFNKEYSSKAVEQPGTVVNHQYSPKQNLNPQ